MITKKKIKDTNSFHILVQDWANTSAPSKYLISLMTLRIFILFKMVNITGIGVDGKMEKSILDGSIPSSLALMINA